MKELDRRLRAYGLSSMPEPDESKIKDTIVNARKSYDEAVEKIQVTYFDFLYDQTRYIRKRWWSLQFFLLFLAGWYVRSVEDVWKIRSMFGIAAPLFVVMVIPELWKNRSANAMEVEGAACFSIRQIYSARLLAFAAVDGVFLSLFTAALSMTGKVIIWEMIVQFFLPMTVTCCICFRGLCGRRAVSEYTACVLSLLWAVVWMLVILNDNVYRTVSVPVWTGICGMAAAYLTYTVKRMLRESLWAVEACSRESLWAVEVCNRESP